MHIRSYVHVVTIHMYVCICMCECHQEYNNDMLSDFGKQFQNQTEVRHISAIIKLYFYSCKLFPEYFLTSLVI